MIGLGEAPGVDPSRVASSTVHVVDLADPASPRDLARLDIPRRGEPGAHGLAYVPRAT
ncbi:hypothetical protein GCM10009801_47160 [Streptomyces albiaxialis]|uniref:Uncharacterized protein n=1 Tax=Streptomyces albiaxialis TaxID=329523 RepID=A0ABN2W884_9ACTN